MGVPPSTRHRGLTPVWLIRIAFSAVIAGFIVANCFSMAAMRGTEQTNTLLLDNMLTSIELVSRIARDIDQKRFAIDDHVMTSVPQERVILEQRLTTIDRDFTAAAAAYEPIVTLPGEAETWKALERDVVSLKVPIDEVLELSRLNRDAEARLQMDQLDDRFDAINHAADQLIRMNRQGAYDAAATVVKAQHTSMVLLAAITGPIALLAMFAALLVMRTVRRRDRQLRDAWARLELQNRELDAFAGRAAHDLRGRLTAVDMAMQRMAAKQTAAESRTYEMLRRGVVGMDQLISDLLALSRAGTEAALGAAPIVEVIDALASDLRPLLSAAGGVLTVNVEAATLHSNPGLLRHALWNLAENAVKYRRTEAQLALDIRGHRSARGYELQVSDNGCGMSTDTAQHAFEPFFRGDNVHGAPGTGLGLSIVHRIVEACGGTVTLTSQPEVGTRFVISLRLEPSTGA